MACRKRCMTSIGSICFLLSYFLPSGPISNVLPEGRPGASDVFTAYLEYHVCYLIPSFCLLSCYSAYSPVAHSVLSSLFCFWPSSCLLSIHLWKQLSLEIDFFLVLPLYLVVCVVFLAAGRYRSWLIVSVAFYSYGNGITISHLCIYIMYLF